MKGRLTIMFYRPLLASIVSASLTAAVLANDLEGVVTDSEGQPIRDATVMISTAAPRVGVSIFCPSCYADCGRKVRTGDDGRFVLLSLDPALKFRIVVTAEGYRAQRSELIDPVFGATSVQLAQPPAEVPPAQMVRGRVVDTAGKPVVGAVVEPFGCKRADRRWWGSLPGVDPLSVTNQEGEFFITCVEPAEAFDLEVQSPRHAKRRFELIPTGNDAEKNKLTVESGVIVRGRLVRDGNPVSGASLGLVDVDRGGDSFVGHFEIATNAQGLFEFFYMPPQMDYYLYTLMERQPEIGALPLRRVTVDKSDTVMELGDLELGAAHIVQGRILLTDGKSLPGPIQLLLGREGAWDSQRVMVAGDGVFRFDNVPHEESVTLSIRIPGYRLASNRNRFQQVREWSIAMHVDGPREDVEIWFEPHRAPD